MDLVHIAQMADAEQLASDLGQTATQRQVVAVVGARDHISTRNASRQHDSGDGVGVPLFLFGAQVKLPALGDRSAHTLCQVAVAGNDLVEALFFDHLEGFNQAVHQRQGRGVGKVAVGVGLLHVDQVKVCALELGVRVHGQRFGAGAQDAQSCGQHETLLRAGDSHVYAPVVKTEVDAAQRRHAVDEQQRGVLGLVQRLTHASDVRDHASSSFVLAGQDGLDAVLRVSLQDVSILLQWHAGAPLAIHNLHIQTQALAHVDPQVAELPEARGQDGVAGRQGVSQRRFPAASARGRKHKGRTDLGAVDGLQAGHDGVGQHREMGGAVVFHGHHHGALDAVWNIGGTGNKQKITTCHGCLLGE